MRGKLTGVLEVNDAEDTSLGDAYLSQLPQRVNDTEMECIEFVRGYSQYLIGNALERGETDITILDVYESLSADFLRNNPDCPMRYMGEGGEDLLSSSQEDVLERYAMACEKAYRYLLEQQPQGMFINIIHNMLDVYAISHAERPGFLQWSNFRKDYTTYIAPACFFVFPAYVTARDFFKTTTVEYLVAMASDDGIIIDDTVVTVLPRSQRDNIKKYLSSIPQIGVDDDTGLFYSTDEAEEFHNLMLSGIRGISAARLL